MRLPPDNEQRREEGGAGAGQGRRYEYECEHEHACYDNGSTFFGLTTRNFSG